MSTPDARETVEAVWRIESARIVGALTRMVGDVGRAEDCAQEALVVALEEWPESGVPDKPGAWLMTAAKRRAIDDLRRRKRFAEKEDQVAHEMAERRGAPPDPAVSVDDSIGDDVLRLMFLCCHPILSREARVALTLRLCGGLTTREIARAFLVPVPTLAQRIVRAKRSLREADAPFELPPASELSERLSSVLEVVYLIFNEGYAASAGDEWVRPALCRDAIRLGRILAGLAPEEAEVHGLVALMELQASRLDARTGAEGEAVLLEDQDRARWDPLLLRRGLGALDRAESLAGPPGRYTLQAKIAACHARAPSAEETDWIRVVALYGALARVEPSPVVALNQAVAVGRAFGPEQGLRMVDALQSESELEGYHLQHAVRGDLLERLDRRGEARSEFERAASLTRNERERQLLLERASRVSRSEHR